MQTLRYIALFFCVSISAATAQKAAQQEEWTSIFNGKDLSGWDIKIAGLPLNDNYKNTFRVENGMLRVMYDQYKTFDGKYGHIYYKKPYSYYRVRFKYRFLGNQTPGGDAWNVRNSGIMLHSQSAKSLSLGQTFPVSLEMQLLGGLGQGPRHTGNLCTPGTQMYMDGKLHPEHCTDSDSKTYDGDRWIMAEAIVLGDSIVHHLIEGDTVLTYERPQVGGGFVSKDSDWNAGHFSPEAAKFWTDRANTPLGEGYIALQAESHPIDFKEIEILDLKGCTDPKALNYKSYYVKSDNTQCRYKK
ncbi:3-keto-disaccharide hydrolase [Spirosoma sp.]|uniref:3-keto-disaccharide hydrolase n=1 Tax=Spirosoma sp. TaxID=1899569 RepID=UPI003B3AA330